MKNKISYAAANAIASKVIERLSSSCVRIEVAGSLRRKAATVGDIEIMIVPEPELYDYLDNLLSQKKIRLTEPKRWGEKFRSFMMTLRAVIRLMFSLICSSNLTQPPGAQT